MFHRHVLLGAHPFCKEETTRHSAYIYGDFLVTCSHYGTFISTGYAASTDSFHDTRVCLVMFLILSVIAEIVNSFGHFVLSDRKPEPNMFQITPYYPSTQVVFSSIAKTLGVIPEIIIYLVLIIAMSYVIFRIEQKIFDKKR